MKLIGLSGRKGAGKDTVFRFLREHHPELRIARVAFADALKEEVAQCLEIPVSAIEADKPRFRLILQWWGTEWRRHQCPTYWIDRAREKIAALRDTVDVVVVTDVRFINEARLIDELAGRVVRVANVRAETSADAHLSEIEMDDYPADAVIGNHGDLLHLYEQVRGFDLS
jgi:hypothetical protein